MKKKFRVNFENKFILFSIILVLSKIFLIFLSLVFGIIDEKGNHISFFNFSASGDYEFYSYFSSNPFERMMVLFNFYDISLSNNYKFYPGPLFPFIIRITNYYPTGSIFYAHTLYQFLIILSTLHWVKIWTHKNQNQYKEIAILAVILFPYLNYYSFVISSDIIFFTFYSIIYYYVNSYVIDIDRKIINTKLFIILFLYGGALLTRPNALILFIPILYFIWNGKNNKILKIKFTILLLILTVFFMIYYIPYLTSYRTASEGMKYFGYSDSFLSFELNSSKDYLNNFLTYIVLLLYKVMYMFGIRESFTKNSHLVTLIRVVLGFYLLLGTLFMIKYKNNMLDKLFVFPFMLPIVLGAAQERYILHCMPLMIYYFHKNIRFNIEFKALRCKKK